MYRSFLKSLLDYVLSLLGLLVLLPVLLAAASLLAVAIRGIPFYFQKRPGKNRKLFWVIKLKTMRDRKNENGELLPDAERLTPLGKFIRKTSLDEVPQLLNVILGDMSLVGPRPLLPEYLSLYNEVQMRRHEVKPGITGWAQINGRNGIGWQEKFDLDVWYVDNLSFTPDCKIIYKTIKKVFRPEHINYAGHATMPAFNGNKNTA